jgi:hypothetical protein
VDVLPRPAILAGCLVAVDRRPMVVDAFHLVGEPQAKRVAVRPGDAYPLAHLEAVMNSISNGLGMRKTGIGRNQAGRGIRTTMRFSPEFITRSRRCGALYYVREPVGRLVRPPTQSHGSHVTIGGAPGVNRSDEGGFPVRTLAPRAPGPPPAGPTRGRGPTPCTGSRSKRAPAARIRALFSPGVRSPFRSPETLRMAC